MDRSFSLPPLDTFNPFWSERVRDERLLEKLRPADLPKVPTDEWDFDLPPVRDGRTRGKGSGGSNLEEKVRKRSRSGDETGRGRGRIETRLNTTIEDFETPPSGWMFGRQNQHLDGEGQGQGGFSSRECGDTANSSLERELEKSVCRLLHEENVRLKMEIEKMKETARTESSWSEVPSTTSFGWTPPPPPVDECPQTPRVRVVQEDKWTPMGTKVPPEPVEHWLPPIPPMPVTSVNLGDYEWLDGRRPRSQGRGLGARDGCKDWEAIQKSEELETEVEALQALLRSQASGGWSGYWSMAVDQGQQDRDGSCHDDRALQGREGVCRDSRAWQHHQGICQGDRALQPCPGIRQGDRVLQPHPGSGQGDRALQPHPGNHQGDRAPQLQAGLCHQDRACWSQLGNHRGDRASQQCGGSYHGVQELRQQLDCGQSSAPRGEDMEEEKGSGLTDSRERIKLEKEIARLKRELEEHGVDLERAKKSANLQKEEEAVRASTGQGVAPNDGNMTTGRTLPELKGDINPITLGDWLVLISPVMKDLTPNSSEWWEHTKSAAEHFYTKWRGSSPLDRVQIQPELPAKLRQHPYLRTEQRGVSLLLQAIPEDIRQLLVASRELCSTTILYRLLVTFQPGGPNEKALLLRKLTEIAVGKDLSELGTSIRGWRRHFQRALEIQTTLPDPTLLVHALDGPSGVVARLDSQAAFRLAQSRSQLAVDESPTQENVWLFSQCVLAEVESLQLQSGASTAVGPGAATGPKVKQLEVKSPPRLTKDGQQRPCHFWGSNDGCKMGARCGFLHDWSKISDRQGRCWNCSATSHMKPDCPARQEASQSRNATGGSDGGEKDGGGKDGGGKKGGKGKKGGGKNKGSPQSSSTTTTNGSTQEVAQEKTTSTTPPENGQSGGKPALASIEPSQQPSSTTQPTAGEATLVQEVTSLLRSLRTDSAAIKVCSVRRISNTDEQMVLIDGGATHCLREVKSEQEWEDAKEIRVALAEGDTIMKQVDGTKTLITRERVQPIVPMCLVTALGYKVEWTAGECKIYHGHRGQLPVTLCQGCPTLPMKEGLRLMEEVEQLQCGRAAIRSMLTGEREVDPTQRTKMEMLKKCFPQVPLDLLQKVPGNQQWKPESLPWNRRRRRQCERARKLVIYMCSGPEESEWLKWQDKDTAVLCLDVMLGCDLLNDDVAGWMEHLVTTRSISLWLSSPPCRTVSVCRNDEDGGPPVIRGDGPQDRFGLPNLKAHHQRQVEQDSVLWLRNLYWMALAYETSGETMESLIEQPRDPNEWREQVKGVQQPSFLRWPETKIIQEMLKLKTIRLEQGALGHPAVKPTTLLSSIPEVWQLQEMKQSQVGKHQKKEEWPTGMEDRIQKTRSMSAWAPGLKSLLWKVIGRMKSGNPPTVAKLTTAEMEDIKAWEEHVRRGHVPYRKDCAICVETKGRDRRHVRQAQVDSFTLSLDIAGPFEPGYDQHVVKPKYYLTGVITIPKVGQNPLVEGLRKLGGDLMSLKPDKGPLPSCSSSAQRQEPSVLATVSGGRGLQSGNASNPPQLKPIQEIASEAVEVEGETEEDPFQGTQQESLPELSVTEIAEADLMDRQWAEWVQGKTKVEVDNLSQSIPLRSRSTKDVIHATALLYTRLKSLQIPVSRVHTDRAKEFLSKEFRQWTLSRDLRQSTTAGDEPQTNGRVECELGIIRGEARSILKSSRLPTTYWPLAIRAASESRFRSQLRGLGVPVAQPLPFGLKAYAHQKRWHRTSDWQSPKQLVTLLGPAADMTMTSGGYYAELPNGRCILTTAVIVPTSSKSTQQRLDSVADLGGQNQEDQRGEMEAEREGEIWFDENIIEEEPLHNPHSPEILHEAITEVEVEPIQTAGLGERQRFPKTTGLTHRLHGKQTVLNTEVAIPTVASLALRTRGESEAAVAMKEGILCDQWQQDLVWMLFQHQSLSQVCQELVLDIQEGIERSWMGKVLEKAQSEVKVLEGRLKALQGVEQEQQEATAQVLQTKTVSMAEVKENYKEWTEPFQEEYQTLIKTVIKPLSASQAREEIGTATKVQRVPGKLVATVKPPSKKRGRIVACGNYADQATSETSASGLDTICIRAMVRVAADRGWSLTSTDVRKAFLNAPRVEKEGHLTLVDPPRLLQTMGITKPGEVWKIQGALYGFQESPHHWSIHRDKTLLGLVWGEQQQFWLEETKEKNLWKICHRSLDGSPHQVAGYVGIYVDDVLVAAPTEVASEFMKCLQSTWECAESEWLTPTSKNKMRFCGYEIGVLPQGGFSLSQPSYVKDLLRKHEIQNEFEKVAAPRIVAAEDEEFDQFTLHQAQMITGELQWVQSRTRPDLAFIVNAMSRWTHRRPKYVWEIGCHVLRFLNFSQDWELWYEPSKSNDWGKDGVLQKPRSMSQLEVYIDTSFGLEHEQSRSVHGMLHEWAGAPLQWHSGRQPWIAASTGEAELIGYAEAHQQALSIGSVIELFHEEPSYVMYGDCKAALALATAENGPWRTRHLRMRAHRLRESLRPPTSDPHAEPRWSARHLDGKKLVSDGLTKPLQGSLFQQFALRLGLHGKGLDIPVGEGPTIKKIIEPHGSEEGEIERIKMLMILGGLLLKSQWPVWISCGVALVLCGIKKLKERGYEKDKVENAPCLRAFRPFGSDQHPIRPTRDPQQSTASQRGQAVVDGYTNSGAMASSTTSEVPGWWDLPEVQRPLGGKDRWMILDEKWLVRVHGESRRRCFQPVHRSCPVDISKIGATRYSLVYPANDRFNRRLREDQWKKPTTWMMDYLWVGFTIFEIEKDEAQQTPFTGHAASSVEPPVSTGDESRRTRDQDDSWLGRSSYAPAVQNTSHGPIVNVTVNVNSIPNPVEIRQSTTTRGEESGSDLDGYEMVFE